MYMREAPTRTVTDLLETVESATPAGLTLTPGEVTIDVPNHVIDLKGTEVALNATGLKALGDALDVPSAFLLRQDADFQQVILSTLLARKSAADVYAYTEADGLLEVRNPGVQVITPARLLGVASRVIDPLAPVRDFWSNSSDFRLDVMAPEGFDRGIGGDIAVGDLSASGIRITQDRKHNLAPAVQPFQYRFFCTNGMSTRHDGLKVDARGQSVEEVLAELESLAEIAFRAAETEIESFYGLREDRVDNPERTLLRFARDAGLPNRTVTTLLERVPGLEDEVRAEGRDFVSTFDLVNLMTNQANDPAQRRPGYRLALESAAGGIVTEHAERCSHCQSRLVH